MAAVRCERALGGSLRIFIGAQVDTFEDRDNRNRPRLRSALTNPAPPRERPSLRLIDDSSHFSTVEWHAGLISGGSVH
jgi:hypothetical protein